MAADIKKSRSTVQHCHRLVPIHIPRLDDKMFLLNLIPFAWVLDSTPANFPADIFQPPNLAGMCSQGAEPNVSGSVSRLFSFDTVFPTGCHDVVEFRSS